MNPAISQASAAPCRWNRTGLLRRGRRKANYSPLAAHFRRIDAGKGTNRVDDLGPVIPDLVRDCRLQEYRRRNYVGLRACRNVEHEPVLVRPAERTRKRLWLSDEQIGVGSIDRMVRIIQATDMDKLVGRDEMLDAVAGLALHAIKFIATDSHLCRYHRRFRDEHEGPSDALRLPEDELRIAVHIRGGEILYLKILTEGRVGQIA